MRTCTSCGQQFFAGASAWGDDTCGVCIAGQLESLLMASLPARVRRPMRRAGDDSIGIGAEAVSVGRRNVEEGFKKVSGE